MTRSLPLTKALTIATTDSSGGAGINADLKTFAALGVYGLSVICSVTAQNTRGVMAVENLSQETVKAQMAAVWADIPPQAIKIGLIGSAALAEVVSDFLREKTLNTPIVLDPVLVSASGHVFLNPKDVAGLKDLFPLATLLTPNAQEAAALTGLTLNDPDFVARAGEKLLEFGPRHVLIKGGHLAESSCDDYLFSEKERIVLNGSRLNTKNDHGAGCTLSSAIAAYLAQGQDLIEAARLAKKYVANGFFDEPKLGHGPGPLNHFHAYYAWT
ncbi:MAG: bifunctional hydroxymethylpyrimidine kinase/phosphomethylpyrimidine kinase [Deltaproteobacteria bacterium]|jgi:hydroxymethylpyrimidine/phosphomethylpyrimidine kinase|nr:bifunctional hydroxymethylpyrimidine kinase/phosphomethylpyrimidine kinase [Deltaproteobacteria bacterium]